METLKKLAFTTLCMILFCQVNVNAQDYKLLQEAFSNSYTLETTGKYTAACDALKKYYDEKSYEINVRLGWLSYLAGQFNESIAYYTIAIQLMPLSVEARLGYVYPASAMGNWDQVTAKYQEILKLDASNYTANYRLGSIYYTRKEYEQAFRHFEKLVNAYPFDYDALHMFAWTNFQMGKLREAKVLFNKTLLNKPGDASATEGLGMIK